MANSSDVLAAYCAGAGTGLALVPLFAVGGSLGLVGAPLVGIILVVMAYAIERRGNP